MSDLRKAAEMAWNYFRNAEDITVEGKQVMEALRQALAQPEQRLRVDNDGDIRPEPYPKAYENKEEFEEAQKRLMKELKQREQEPVDWEAVAADQAMTIAMMKVEKRWVGLTDDEVLDCWKQIYEAGHREYVNAVNMARAVEAKLKENNT
jgi:hypothetical protein